MTHGRLVFRSNTNKFLQFAGAGVVIYILNLNALDFVISKGFGTLIGQAILLPIFVVLSYLMNRYLVFRPETES